MVRLSFVLWKAAKLSDKVSVPFYILTSNKVLFAIIITTTTTTIIIIFINFVWVHVCGGQRATYESHLSLTHVGCRNWTEVRSGDKCLSLQSLQEQPQNACPHLQQHLAILLQQECTRSSFSFLKYGGLNANGPHRLIYFEYLVPSR